MTFGLNSMSALATMLVLLTSSASAAQTTSGSVPDPTTIDIDLEPLRAEVRSAVPGALAQSAPQLFSDRRWFRLRWHGLHAEVDSVSFSTRSESSISVHVRVHIWGDQERRTAPRRWAPWGPKHLYTVELDGFVEISAQATNMAWRAVASNYRVAIHVSPFESLTTSGGIGRDVASGVIRFGEVIPLMRIEVLDVANDRARVRCVFQ